LITAFDRDRLAKILGMLGSGHPGEVSTAGKAAHELIRDAGMTWPEVLGLEGTGAAEGAVRELRAEKEVLQSRLNAYISENAALRDEIKRLKSDVAFPKLRARPVVLFARSRGLRRVTFVSGTAAIWAALLLGIGPPAILGPSLAALLLLGLYHLVRSISKSRRSFG
jgi:hypothetical protein